MTTDPTANLRLFFALPAEGIATTLRPVHDYFTAYSHVVKTVSPEQYHITVKFLGETSKNTGDQLLQDFSHLNIDIPPIDFTLQGLGAFPDIRKAKVLWCGIGANRNSLYNIMNAIDDICALHGFNKENKPFHPHFTLARIRKEQRIPPALADYISMNKDTVFGKSIFDRIVLFKSDLRREGPIYTPLGEKKL